MKVNTILPIFLLLSLISCGIVQAGATANNDDFVKTAFMRTIDSLMTDFQAGPTLNLDFKCSDCPRDFYLNILTSILKQKVSDLYIDNREKQIPNLEVTLSGSGFYFEREGGSIFSSGNLLRKYDINIFLTLTDPDNRLIWQNEGDKTFSEKIEWDEARNRQNKFRGIFNASLPSTNRSRIWEPVIISGLLGGLVYLFFASR